MLKQRKNRTADTLSAEQIEALTRIGMVWSVRNSPKRKGRSG
ncbi:hypothetical protein ACFVZ5_13270 [Streptomyces sp. NPDC059570]